jgi:uncharacterized protein YfaS (alpha-2-macroglobulin family)
VRGQRHGAIVLLFVALLLGGASCRGSQTRPAEGPTPERAPAAEIVAVLDEAGPPPGDPSAVRAAPAVIEHGPRGAAEGEHVIYLRFSAPMQPVTEGEAALAFSLEPELAGTAIWVDPYRLDYVLDELPPPAIRVKVHVHGRAVATDGTPLPVDLSWELTTERPLAEIHAREDSRHGDPLDAEGRPLRHAKVPFIVSLTPSVRPELLKAHVKVTTRPRAGGPETPVAFRVRRPTDADLEAWYPGYAVHRGRAGRPRRAERGWSPGELLVEPLGHWPTDAVVTATIDADFRTPFGPVTLGRAVAAELATLPGLDVKIACEIDHGDGCGPGEILVELDGPVSLKRLAAIEVTPRPRGLRLVRPDFAWPEDHALAIRGKFEAGRTYRVTVPTTVQDAWGLRPVAPVVFEAKFVDPPPEVSLSSTHGTLAATEARTVGLETRWVKKVRLRAAVLTDEQLASQWLRAPEALEIPKKPRREIDREIELAPDEELGWSSIAIDLADISEGERRPVLVQVEPLEMMARAAGRPQPGVARGIWQQTDLGAVAVVSPARSLARVHGLSDGSPRADVEIDLLRATLGVPAKALGRLGTTDASGVIELPRSIALPKRGLVRMRSGDDRFLLRVGELRDPSRTWRSWSTESAYSDPSALLHELVTERPLYRPGDEVHVVGWLAISDSHSPAGLRPPKARTTVELSLVDREGEAVARRRVRTTAHGKYWATLALPKSGSLGHYRVVAKIEEHDHERVIGISVREFATPSFQVTVDTAEGDVLHGEAITARVAAEYYFGGTVPLSSVSPRVPCNLTAYRPPGLEPSWVQARVDRDEVPWHVELETDRSQVAEGRGRATVTASTTKLAGGMPYRCTAAVAVTDASLEQVGGETSVLVHPASYLFARAPRSWMRVGEALKVPVRVTDFSGARRGGVDVVVSIERDDVEDTDTGWKTKTVAVKTCRLRTTSTGDDPVCETKPRQGAHRITVHAAKGVAVSGDIALHAWVGPKIRSRRHRSTAPLALELSPERPRPGDKAEVRIASTKQSGEGVVVLAHGGVRRVHPFTLKAGVATLPVAVDESWVPGMTIRAALVIPGSSGEMPHVLEDELRVNVDAEGRRLNVQVRPPAETRPDAEIEIPVELRDAEGAPTAGHVALWAVDEAVLSLQEPVWPDLVARFAVDRGERARIEHDYDLLQRPYTPRPDPYLGPSTGHGGGSGFGSGHGRGANVRQASAGTPPARQRFETTPIFVGDVEVGASGEAVVKGRMPENLTTFRITAIASAPLPDHEGVGRFGMAEARTRVTVPLALRAVLPRVLRPGDRAQIAAMVDNRTGPPGIVKVSLRTRNAKGVLRAEDAAPREVPIEAGGQVRVPFSIHALGPGVPNVELSAVLTPYDGTKAELRDAMKVPLPVTVERTLVRRSAVYGEIDDDTPIAVEVQPPEGAIAAKLETSADATLLGGLHDVAGDLVQYPYGCLEQTASRLVPLVALGRLDEHHLPENTDVDAFVAAGVARLRSMQTNSGGFGYWPGDDTPHPYASSYGLWVLEQVKAAGHEVPETTLVRARDFVSTQVQAWAKHPAPSPQEDVQIAMAVHALAAGGGDPEAAIARLVELHAELPTFARALLVLAIAEIDRDDPRLADLASSLAAEVDRQGALAHVRRTSGRWWQFFDSGTRTDAMVLLALLAFDPDHPLVVPLARGLSVHRGGGLHNTQERAYGLLALAGYAAHHEPGDPSFLASVWLGALPGQEARFDALDAATLRADAPLVDLLLGEGDAAPRVTLRRKGEGRMYWRVGMTWSPKTPPTEPVAAGIAVTSTLRDASGEVRADSTILPGTPLALDVTVTADTPLDYVALEVPLPAGLEAIDTSIGRGRAAMLLPGEYGWWVDHRELHADRALVFADRLPPGSRTHTLHLRAATPGEFSMPPPHAEAMYLPEIHGHGVARRVTIAAPSE